MCVCGLSVFACGQHHFTFIEMSSAPRGPGAELRPAAMLASIDYSGIKAWLRQPSAPAPTLPRGPGEVTRSETKFSRGGLGELSWAQIRGPRPLPPWRHERVKRYGVFVRAPEHTQSVPSGKVSLCSHKALIGNLVTYDRY